LATPPSDASEDSDGAPRRYRTIPDLLDSTDELTKYEYSGICLSAAEDCWREAMRTEMQAIEENGTWVVCDLPAKQRAIGLKWVFKLKKDPEGRVVKHKARLVAKGYAQRQGVDFEEVFASVDRIEQ
jgi:hypothetical protein